MSTLSPEKRRELAEQIEEELEDDWDDDGSESPGAQLLRGFGEIRRRILIVFGSLVVGALVAAAYAPQIFEVLIQPLCGASLATPAIPGVTPSLIGNCTLYPTSPLEPMLVFFKLSLLVGLFASMPVLFYQVWAMIAPRLTSATRSWMLTFVGLATLSFVGGAAFGFFVVFPPAFAFMLAIGGPNIVTLATPTSYFSILSMLLLGFGASFELPLLMFMLSRLGVTNWRFYAKYWRHSIFLLLVFSAVITPTTDPFTMLMLAGPLALLYGVGLLASFVAGKKGPTLLESRLRQLDEFKDDFEDEDDDDDEDAAGTGGGAARG